MNPFEKQTIVIGEYSIKDIVKTNKKIEDVWKNRKSRLNQLCIYWIRLYVPFKVLGFLFLVESL